MAVRSLLMISEVEIAQFGNYKHYNGWTVVSTIHTSGRVIFSASLAADFAKLVVKSKINREDQYDVQIEIGNSVAQVVYELRNLGESIETSLDTLYNAIKTKLTNYALWERAQLNASLN